MSPGGPDRPPGTGGSDRPLLVFDGACAFCRLWVRRWHARLGDRAGFAPYQQVGRRFPDIDEEAFRRASWLIEPDGTRRSGAAAALRLQAYAPGHGFGWSAYRRVPGLAPALEAGYRAIAHSRGPLYRLTRLGWGDHPEPGRWAGTAWIVLRAVAAVYLVAFVSLGVQIAGLVGPDGILPVGQFLDLVRQAAGSMPRAVHYAPTLAWLGTGDSFLVGLAAAGAVCATLLLLDVAPLFVAIGAWVLYLSLTVAGQDFLSFQWDALLLETGFLAIVLAGVTRGPGIRPALGLGGSSPRRVRAVAPPFVAILLFWWLAFRLTFESGLVKLASGDPAWRDGTALSYHWWSQPLPNPIAWTAARLPLGVDRAATFGALAIELGTGFLFFLPRRIRHLGAALAIGLQALIFATGNYGFFNLLAVALALSLYDDDAWAWLARRVGAARAWRRIAGGPRSGPPPCGGAFGRAFAAAFLALAVLVGAAQLARIVKPALVPRPLARFEAWLQPFMIVNPYGLFAVMTKERPELVFEGRDAGGAWRELDFRFKPDDPAERPHQVAPHMPRLDWQMWFAALGVARGDPYAPRWVAGFVDALLRGSPAVTALLDPGSPFRERPPDQLRILLYDYRFTTAEQRSRTGDWWIRDQVGVVLPAVERTENGLTPVAP